MRWAIAAMILAGCFSPRYDECRVRCGVADCPGTLTCGTDGYCHALGDELCGPPVTPDGTPDSPIVVVEDADPGLDAPCEIELLANGGFEATDVTGPVRVSPPWVASGAPLPSLLMTGEDAFVAHGGTWGVRFGEGHDRQQFLVQDLGTLPAGTRALRLSFHYQALSVESLFLRDIVEFELVEGATEIATLTYVDGHVGQTAWTLEEAVREGAFGGRQLSLRLHLTTDGSQLSAFPIDDISLRAVVCD